MSIFKKQVPVAAPVAPTSVAEITAGLSDTLAELEALAEDEADRAAYQREVSAVALNAADKHAAEAELAVKVAGNIKALLGA